MTRHSELAQQSEMGSADPSRCPLSAELTDLIAEALVWSAEPQDRATVLLQIVSCAVDAVTWRLQPEGDPREELSAQQVLMAASEHLARMRACQFDQGRPIGPGTGPDLTSVLR